ncbi:hypothetical protein K443DRAFT_670870 [Laccaria amethystina LaAM-08-1]|uniref:Uncharacterized protein n=1 Tax=Laccaria amethystina LaAM-08-1 TaxID=1095629 RepID=A0A0C9YIU3_9AGAR|nr:hypothetical protein K443DRAFT_670870 [Laccaria amethystina LaAM-08-1]
MGRRPMSLLKARRQGFCVALESIPLQVEPGSANVGDGDLPGEGGGDPKRESSSSSSSRWSREVIADQDNKRRKAAATVTQTDLLAERSGKLHDSTHSS